MVCHLYSLFPHIDNNSEIGWVLTSTNVIHKRQITDQNLELKISDELANLAFVVS